MRAEDILPDDVNQGDFGGVAVRKGSVGAFLASVKTLVDSTSSDQARAVAERDMIDLLPALYAIGLFDVLEVRDERIRTRVDAHLRG